MVVDLQSAASSRLEGFITVYTSPEGGLTLGAPAWSPDGSKVAAVGDLPKGSVLRVMRLDLSQVVTQVALPDLQNGSASFFSWSPRGDYWIAGELIINTTDPHLIWDLRVQGQGEPAWSASGVWFARSSTFDGWGELRLFHVDANKGPVAERSLGQGFPCGWDSTGKFYFIRWPGADQRFQPEWD